MCHLNRSEMPQMKLRMARHKLDALVNIFKSAFCCLFKYFESAVTLE